MICSSETPTTGTLMSRSERWLLIFLVGFGAAAMAFISKVSYGHHFEYTAELVSVYDGDSMTLRMEIYPGVHVDEKVRLHGVDTPEYGWRAQCEFEEELANLAKDYTQGLLRAAKEITVRVVQKGSYGRMIGRVFVDKKDLSRDLINAGYGRHYTGGKREGWCHENEITS